MRVRSPGGKICSSLETPQTLHADRITSTPDDMIMAPLWGDRAQGPRPYNWACPDWHSLNRAWSQGQAGECSLVFSLRAGKGRAGSPAGEALRAVLSAPWAGQVLPGRVLSCPPVPWLDGWTVGMCWGLYLSGSRAVSSRQIPSPGVPDTEGDR